MSAPNDWRIPEVHVPAGDADVDSLSRRALALCEAVQAMAAEAIGVRDQHAARLDLLAKEAQQARAFALTVTTENARLQKEVHELRAELALAREALKKISPDLRNDSR